MSGLMDGHKEAAGKAVDALGNCSWGRAYHVAFMTVRQRMADDAADLNALQTRICDSIARACAAGKPEKLEPVR